MEVSTDECNYAEQVRRLFQTRRCVESSFSPADQKLAAGFFRQRIGLDQIETALLLGCARKYVALLNGKISGPISSLSFFQAVVEEVGKLQMSGDYTKYLRQRVARLEEQWLGRTPLGWTITPDGPQFGPPLKNTQTETAADRDSAV